MKRLRNNLIMYQSDTKSTRNYRMKSLENGTSLKFFLIYKLTKIEH